MSQQVRGHDECACPRCTCTALLYGVRRSQVLHTLHIVLQMRDVVRALAEQFPTAIISGRGREKVENFVQLKELYYAGSHGMDIAGPSVSLQAAVPRNSMYCC